jgi:PPOX class probable F420-dependent enzyme
MTPSPFDNQRYIVMETFRKNGTPVSTPLGFVKASDTTLYVSTTADSGKVKRLRNNNRVRVAPGTGGGQPLGAWHEATATFLDATESKRVYRLIVGKYPVIWRVITTVDAIQNFIQRKPAPEWLCLRIDLTPTLE